MLEDGPSPILADRPGWLQSLCGRNGCALVVLAGLVLVAHYGVLHDGVFYDDHWHRVNLRACGWSWTDLVEATTFDFPGNIVHLWWQEVPLQWRYPRPVAMFFMKAEYELARGNPLVMHAFGLVWHWLTAFLVYRLARWVLRSPAWALLVAAVFVLNPNSAFAISWSAARNALVSTVFLLGAVLAYAAASFDSRRQPAALRPAWLALSVALWLLALFSRETSVIFPGLVLLMDLCFGGWRHAWRRGPMYVGLGIIAAAYLYWRLHVFPVATAPEMYFRTPQGLAYLVWAFCKLSQLVFALTAYLPLVGQLEPLADWGWRTTLVSVLAIVLLLPGTIDYVRRTRGVRGRWFGPLWMVLALAPLVPVASMPHFGYLPFAGWALALGALLQSYRGRRRAAVLIGASLCIVGAFAAHRMLWRGAFRAEQLIYTDIVDHTPPPRPGSTVFLINAPTWATFAPPALREKWGVEDLQGQILTMAPECYRMRDPSTIQQISDHELLVSTPPPGYFSSFLTGALLRMSRPYSPLPAGLTVPGTQFDTTVLEATHEGITKLKFTFHAPLARDDYYFYVSTPERPAERLRFDTPVDSATRQGESARFNTEHTAEIAERNWLFWVASWFPLR